MRDKIKTILKKTVPHIPIIKMFYEQRAGLRNLLYKTSKKNTKLENEIDTLKQKITKKEEKFENGRKSFLKELKDVYYNYYFLPKVKIKSARTKGKSYELKEILTINQGDRGGAAKVAIRLSNELEKLKYKVNILLGSHEFNIKKNTIVLERDESDAQNYLHEYQKQVFWDDLLNFSSQTIKDLPIFKESDIVHLHNLQGAGGYFSLFDLVEISSLKPTVWTLHDMLSIVGDWRYYLEANDYISKGKEFPYTNPQYEKMSDDARFNLKAKELIYKNINTTIVCPAQWLIDRVKNSILKDKEVKLVYNGIDEKIFKPYNKSKIRKELNYQLKKQYYYFKQIEVNITYGRDLSTLKKRLNISKVEKILSF